MDIDVARRVWTATDPHLRRHPYEAYAVLRRHGPVHQATPADAEGPVWYVVGYPQARQALDHPSLVRDVRKLPADTRPIDPLAALGVHRSMIAVDPPEHTRLRKLVSTAFTPRRVAALAPRIEQVTGELLDQMAGERRADLITAFAFPLPAAIICHLLGVPHRDHRMFRGWIRDLFAPAREHTTVRAASRALADYLTRQLDAKRRVPDDGLISALITARHERQQLTDEELLSMVTLLLITGHETTVNLIASATVALLTHPDQLAALRANPDRFADAVEELLRFDGPVETATARWAVEDVVLGGVTIPAGSSVMVVLGAANHDPQYVTDPDRLDLHRGPVGQHLAFGHGVHYCLGAPLARLQAQIALRSLFDRFPHLRLAVPADEVQVAPNLSLRSYTRVSLDLT